MEVCLFYTIYQIKSNVSLSIWQSTNKFINVLRLGINSWSRFRCSLNSLAITCLSDIKFCYTEIQERCLNILWILWDLINSIFIWITGVFVLGIWHKNCRTAGRWFIILVISINEKLASKLSITFFIKQFNPCKFIDRW